MSEYIYVLEYNRDFEPEIIFGSPTMTSRDYHEIRSKCREISRGNACGGECCIYRAKPVGTEFEITLALGSGLVKDGKKWRAGNIVFDYIGRYSHNRDTGCNTEFYADWTLGRDAETRHSMYVVTPVDDRE